jgi:catalase
VTAAPATTRPTRWAGPLSARPPQERSTGQRTDRTLQNGRDLLTAIKAGNFPRWKLFIQVMTEAQAKTHKHNPLDLTKVWAKADYPLIEAGVMELNRYPDNYFAEVEQAAFSPANIVPDIGFSPDKTLQGRLLSYGDTQRYRLGINFNHIPVNAPKFPFQSYHRDGKMRTDGNLGDTLTFNPNSAGLWDNQPDFAGPPMPIEGDAAHWDHRVDDDHWEQCRHMGRETANTTNFRLAAAIPNRYCALTYVRLRQQPQSP